MQLVSFTDYAAIILGRLFPPIETRRQLWEFMGRDPLANLLWTNYVRWHCDLNPANRSITFRAWLKELKREDCIYSEWCLVSDISKDRQLPNGGIDNLAEYLLRINADDSTFDSLESLWIKYHWKSN